MSYILQVEKHIKKKYKMDIIQFYKYSPDEYKLLLLESFFESFKIYEKKPTTIFKLKELESFIDGFYKTEGFINEKI